MKKINKKLTIIKYGSNTLVYQDTNKNISIDYNNFHEHGLIINQITNPVLIVSSGAVAFGKSINNKLNYIKDDIIKKRILAGIGNPHLSINWDKAIKNKTILQSLITHRDLIHKNSRKKIQEIIRVLYQNDNIIIQANDNDFISDEELQKIRGGDFGDNDKLTTLIANICSEIFQEVEIIINTTADGVLNENKKIIKKIQVKKLTTPYIKKICQTKNSTLGTGGMENKLKNIRNFITKNKKTKVFVINGKKPEKLKEIVLKKQNGGTMISV